MPRVHPMVTFSTNFVNSCKVALQRQISYSAVQRPGKNFIFRFCSLRHVVRRTCSRSAQFRLWMHNPGLVTLYSSTGIILLNLCLWPYTSKMVLCFIAGCIKTRLWIGDLRTIHGGWMSQVSSWPLEFYLSQGRHKIFNLEDQQRSVQCLQSSYMWSPTMSSWQLYTAAPHTAGDEKLGWAWKQIHGMLYEQTHQGSQS